MKSFFLNGAIGLGCLLSLSACIVEPVRPAFVAPAYVAPPPLLVAAPPVIVRRPGYYRRGYYRRPGYYRRGWRRDWR